MMRAKGGQPLQLRRGRAAARVAGGAGVRRHRLPDGGLSWWTTTRTIARPRAGREPWREAFATRETRRRRLTRPARPERRAGRRQAF